MLYMAFVAPAFKSKLDETSVLFVRMHVVSLLLVNGLGSHL